MSASQPAYFHLQEFSDLGVPLVGGRLYTYTQGTTALKTAYTDPAGAIPQTYTADGQGGQYIALNARGELPAPLYLAIGSYDIALKRADGSTVWSRRADPTVDGAPTGASLVGASDGAAGALFTTVAGFIAKMLSSAGASLVGFIQAGIGAIIRSIQDKLRERPSVLDYIPTAQHAGLLARTSVYDCLAGINAALAAHQSVLVPGGYRFPVSGPVQVPADKSLYGEGRTSTIYGLGFVGDLLKFGPDGVDTFGCSAENINLSGTATTACSMNHAIGCSLDRIFLDGGTFTDGFKFYYTYPGRYSNLYPNGAAITNACYTYLDEVNACVFDNLYTSNICTYNHLYNGTGHGNTFNNPTAQGGRYGWYMQNTGGFGAVTVNGLYTENCVRPIVLGVRGNPGAGNAQAVVFNGSMLSGPATNHPYYAECIAAIELNSAQGVVFNGTLFLGLARTAGGFPVVTITGDGAGARAIARVKPTGEIHSVEMLTLGSGYTAAAVAITNGGGAGAGATATAAVTAGKVTAVTITAQGAGYKRTQTPVAIMYDKASNVSFNTSALQGVSAGINFPLYPNMVMYSGGAGQYASTIRIDDVSILQGSIGCNATVQKLADSGSTQFTVIERGINGVEVMNLYVPPSYP